MIKKLCAKLGIYILDDFDRQLVQNSIRRYQEQIYNISVGLENDPTGIGSPEVYTVIIKNTNKLIELFRE